MYWKDLLTCLHARFPTATAHEGDPEEVGRQFCSYARDPDHRRTCPHRLENCCFTQPQGVM